MKKQPTGEEVCLCNVWVKDEQWNKGKAAAQATLDHIAWPEQDEQATQRREELQWARKDHWHESQRKLAKEEARLQEQYNQRHHTSGACPDPITDPLGWCEYTWVRKERYKAPKWAADIWSASPMDQKQLVAWMVCLWGLVQAYQQTHQSSYVCPPAPHILEACNHKVNHDTHKELSMQEHAVVQYAWVLEYTSFCNNEWYNKEIAPTVHHFWDEVVKPFGSKALCNLNPSHLLGSWMHLNCGVKIPDYGVQDHIAFVSAPFFQGIESHSQYKQRRKRWEEDHQAELAGENGCLRSHTPSACGQEWEGQDTEGQEHHSRACSKSAQQDWRGRDGGEDPSLDSSCSEGCRLPEPPHTSWDDKPEGTRSDESGSPQTAFKDAMGDTQSSESWYEQVVEEEWERLESSPKTPATVPKGEITCDASMVEDDSLYQWDSDVVIEDEWMEEDMETSASLTPTAPMLPEETPMVQGSEAGDDHLGGQNVNDSNDENPLWDSDINEDELLGAIADVSIPGGHSDDSVALAIPPDERTSCKVGHTCRTRSHWWAWTTQAGLHWGPCPIYHATGLFDQFISYVTFICNFVSIYISNKVVIKRLYWRAWGRVSHAAHYPQLRSPRFKFLI